MALAFTLASSLSANATLLAKWSFDESSGSVANDSVGSFPGTLSANGATFVSGGISGGAISLNRAANGFVNMSNVFGLTNSDYTLVAWLKTEDRTPDSIVLAKHAAYSRNGYFIHLNQSTGLAMQSSNKVFFFQGGSGVGQLQRSETPVSSNNVTDGNWHQIVTVYRVGGVKTIYVDGAPAEDTKPSQTPVGNTASFLIGGVSLSGIPTGRLTGFVDEVQVYNHALSDADIDFLFQNPAQTVLDCTEQVALLTSQLTTANASNAVLQAQIIGLNLTNANLRAQISLLQSTNGLLQLQLTSANNTISSLQAQLTTASTTISGLQASLAAAQAANATLQAQLNAATLENGELQRQLHDVAESLRSLEDFLADEFSDPAFFIPGSSTELQVSNLVSAIQALNPGQQRALMNNLSGAKVKSKR